MTRGGVGACCLCAGTDILKCMALGARGVLLGRPMLYALTLGGQEGAEAALELLRSELELSMALLGCKSLTEVARDFIVEPAGSKLHIPPSRL